MSDLVLSHQDGRSVTLTLNLPQKRNPISAEMRAALIASLEFIRQDGSIRSVILTGAGDAFCSGLDLESLAEMANAADSDAVREANLADSRSIRDFFNYLLCYPKPLIAAVNGPAVAGGAGLALVCDCTIFSEHATICLSEVRLGFVPAIVSVYLQLSIGVKRAKELMLSARTVSAQESLSLGLANAVVSASTLMEETRVRAAQFEKNGPTAMAATKKLSADQFKHKTMYDMDLAVDLNSRIRTTSECREGIEAFLRKKKPTWAYS